MIELRNNPVEGSSLKLGLSFKDPLGKYYIPVYVTYTFLALNSDEESWSVVDNLYEVSLAPQSTISLVIPNVKTITETTLRRKVVIKYQAFIDNQYCDFVDEVNFTIQPKPYIVGPEPVPPEPEIYIQVLSCDLIAGSLITAPLEPVFKMTLNMPVEIDEAEFYIENKDSAGDTIACSCVADMTQTILNISANHSLHTLTHYTLHVNGLKSKVGDYVLEKPFTCNFTTQADDPRIQPSKDVEITENGEYLIQADDEYQAIAKTNLTVSVIPPLQEKTVIENGEVTPDSEYYGLSKVTVDIPPAPLQEKLVTANGVVTPDTGYYGLSRVNVAVPIEPTRFETVSKPGVTHILPGSEYAGMVAVDVNVVPDQDKEVNITTNGDTTVVADDTQLLKSVLIHTAVPLHNVQNVKTITLESNTTTPIEVTPDSGYDCMRKIEITVHVPDNPIILYAYNGDTVVYSTTEITETGNYKMTDFTSGVFTTREVTVESGQISFEDGGTTYIITRNSADDITR